jgi:hypothetical protein
MKKIFYTVTVLSFAALASCGGNAESESQKNDPNRPLSPYEIEQRMKDSLAKLPPAKLTFEQALADTLEFNHNVIIEGYFQLPQLSSTSDRGQSMNFFGRRNQSQGKDIYSNVPTGNGKNKMKTLPDNYKVSDVVITDKNGKTLGINERVRISGSMYASKDYSDPKKHTTYLQITEIEKIDETAFDYSGFNWPELTEDASKKEENYDKEFYLEGKLSVPMFVLTGSEMTIDLNDAKGKQFTVKLVRGSGNSQMEDLSENWSKSDVKIRNNKGELISLNKTVRIYGVLKLDGLHVEEIVSK